MTGCSELDLHLALDLMFILRNKGLAWGTISRLSWIVFLSGLEGCEMLAGERLSDEESTSVKRLARSYSYLCMSYINEWFSNKLLDRQSNTI